jgi:peptidoglycan/LPS O-acetylase OafA/YrhL
LIDPSADSSSRLPALDGVRGIAILLVLQFHVLVFGRLLLPQGAELSRLDRIVFQTLGSGWIGVDLFFVLSGFLITGILLRAKPTDGYFRPFYARRFLRIFPAYYLFLLFVMFLYPLMRDLDQSALFAGLEVDPGERWWFFLYLQNLPMAIPQMHPEGMPLFHLWSLAIEEQFYIVWPLVVLACPRRALPFVCIATMLAALGLRMYMVHGGADWAAASFSTYVFTPARMDSLAAGALIASLIDVGVSAKRMRTGAAVLAVVSAVVLAYIGFSNGTFSAYDNSIRSFGFTLLALTFTGCVVFVVTGQGSPRVLSSGVLMAFGLYSYAMYIIHPVVFAEVAYGVERSGGLVSIGGTYLCSMFVLDAAVVGTTFTVAWLSWHLYEKWFLNLKRHFPYGAARQGRSGKDSPASTVHPVEEPPSSAPVQA